jgi:hypothetical protein
LEIFEGSFILLHSIPAPIFKQNDDLNVHYYTVLQTAIAVLKWELCVVFYLGSSWLKAIAFVVSRWHQYQESTLHTRRRAASSRSVLGRELSYLNFLDCLCLAGA